MRAKSTPTIKRKKETYTKGTMSDEIVVKSSSNFTQEVVLLWPHAFPKKDILILLHFLCALLNSLADFHAKESLTFSRKIRPVVVVVVELFVLFARDRGTKDEKRASSSRSRTLFKKWNYS